ncbi:ATP-dependent exoDNAse (exonuclease V) beta subunit (contains helicase and exonuclease domains) [Desulfurobacterium pacificum]|uniref:DNA 3'-5' helicase n=1 Tax=Desulfurobacterium pacificum TaxID=240166 RepID=A0ABY1N9R1_9BACT|nr:UvrD-helicase domain-containing protein [Desulfurobacterium pacificum]SMP03551.1 ATP-dependent exoDNAse (exonuclease V) beta subunit (contains helicase and exonuclease domains) [Desulfurobacterium pacificum]
MIKLIEANAGAGKTTTLINVYIKLLEKYHPDNIAFITFTEAAAAEIKTRIRQKLKAIPQFQKYLLLLPSAPIGTIHSFCLELLRKYGHKLGFISLDTEIINELKKEKLLDKAVTETLLQFQSKNSQKLHQLLSKIDFDGVSALKDLMKNLKHAISERTRFIGYKSSIEEIVKNVENMFKELPLSAIPNTDVEFDLSKAETKENFQKELEVSKILYELTFKAINNYKKLLKEENAVDYDEILERTLELLHLDNPKSEILNQIKVLIIDEFQDTDPVQWKIVKELHRENPNLLIYLVGDPKQSIYRFRSADIFVWNEAKSISTEVTEKTENYRSAENLLSFFNLFFDHLFNKKYHGFKAEVLFKPFTKTEKTEPKGSVEIIVFRERKERELFAETAISKALPFAEKGTVGVVARTWKSLKIFEKKLKENGIDFTYLSSSPFKAEGLKELLHLLKWLSNPEDKKSLFFFLSSRFIGLSHEQSLKAIIKKEIPELLQETLKTIENALSMKNKELHSALIVHLINKLKILDALHLTDPDSYIAILELISETFFFESSEPVAFEELTEYIESLINSNSSGSTGKNVPEKGFILTTIHSAKGLEFDSVILVPWRPNNRFGRFIFSNVGATVKLFSQERDNPNTSPYHFMLKTVNRFLNELEEKNLLYVGITRAKKQLILGAFPEGKQNNAFKIGGFVFERKDFTKYIQRPKVQVIKPIDEDREEPIIFDPDNLKMKKFERVTPSSLEEVEIKQEKPSDRKNRIAPEIYGTIVHALCQAFVKGASLEKAIKFALSSLTFPPKELEERLKEIYKLLEENYPFLKKGKSEIPFIFREGNTIVKGQIDLILPINRNEAEVWDFKTGNYSKEKVQIYKKQIELYAKAVKLMGYEVKRGIIFFIDQNRTIEIPIS